MTGRQRGVALITALLIVFLCSLLATDLAWVQQLAIRRSSLLQHQQQARLYLLGAEQWAAVILQRDARAGDTDYPSEEWATVPPSLPVQGGAITGRIEDLQGRFNLNNLLKVSDSAADANSDTAGDTQSSGNSTDSSKKDVTADDADTFQSTVAIGADIDPVQFAALQRLLEQLNIAPGIAQAIADWLDSDQEAVFPDGAEDGVYVSQNPAHLAANRPMSSITELRLIAGVDEETYQKLAPYVCALPPGTPLNVNTALPTVLAAAGDGLSTKQAEDAVKSGGSKGYASVDDFMKSVEFGSRGLSKQQLSVVSHFFLLTAAAQVGDGRATLRSLLKRGDKAGVRVVMRSFGEDY
ncbi:MAG: type II secretion system minor pseudopilin GspK [Gammaproteobacteria bacterium]|nr:type II secretion system minor pseudopilin GspK [Gammaproteobacteria bacterium]MCP5425804.1 type II secretion system minor pseudopilin GspK [Gammaproteobacteria bacterium]MCP5458585.1 type II secretion system minor pseudopilin GspK [Gammaproteobacteria bacterium]